MTSISVSETQGIVGAGIQALDLLADKGLYFEGAREALLLETIRKSPGYAAPFDLIRARIEVIVSADPNTASREANVKLLIQGKEHLAVSEGNGPIDAFANAMKKALVNDYPSVADIHLLDYSVSLTNPSKETGASTRVAVTTQCCGSTLTTVDVSSDIVEASVIALCDAYELCLNKIKNHTKSS